MADRDHVLKLLGGEVGTLHVAETRTDATRPLENGTLETLTLRLSDGSEAPAIFLLPPGTGPFPAILYCHAHGNRYDIGRDELIAGRPALTAPYAPDLLARGYAVLCVEMPCFGARAHISESAESKARLWRGTTLFGRMLAEQVAALDWLSARPDIDATRIATLGISMGGTLAWWMAAIDPRIRAAVSLCCFADMDCLIDTGAHDGHGHYMTVPGLLAHATTGEVAGLARAAPATPLRRPRGLEHARTLLRHRAARSRSRLCRSRRAGRGRIPHRTGDRPYRNPGNARPRPRIPRPAPVGGPANAWLTRRRTPRIIPRKRKTNHRSGEKQ